MKKLLLISMLCAGSVWASASTRVQFVAGKPSHGVGEHEFHSGCDILAKAINESCEGYRADVHYDSWPDRGAIANCDVLVVYCDGDGKHVALGHEEDLLSLSNRGAGIVFLHYAVDGKPGLLNETLMKVIGGYYDDETSQNPLWTVKDPVLSDHPIARGVKPFELKDEWYYNLKFGDITPVMSATPPEEGASHVLAWTFGENAFGFTGGHYLSSWSNPEFRKLVLNAIVWAAGDAVPKDGVLSADPVTTKYKTILHAIAKNDPADVKAHILAGVDVNEKDQRGWVPLLHAAVRGKTDCATVLIANGAELNPQDTTRKTPLHYAADRGFLDLVTLLVESGANIGSEDDENWTPLHNAAEKDKVAVAEYLIEQGAVVDALSRRGGTALHEASASASPEMIRLLLDNGADKNIRAANGKTPLDYAIELGNEPAQALLK
jgi:ankyrin repeat protein